jgi:hypothetical protein
MKNIIDKIKNEQHGFILETDLPRLVKHNRFQKCLIRCGGGRFVCAAQDVGHFVGIITRDGTDYVRDVSFPASDYPG